jgi:phosphate transport system substrate-binding protein
MSSYSYMVVPTSTAAPFNTDKGKTLSTFINYFLCTGQQKADILGYSPLPKNLVEAGFKQVDRIPGHVAPPSIDKCNNPALNILHSAPMPSKCMKLGSSCTVSSTTGQTTNNDGSTPSNGTNPSNGTDPNNGTTNNAGTPTGDGSAPPGSSPSGGSNPLTGTPGGNSVTNADGSLPTAAGTPVSLTAARTGQQHAIAWLVALMLALTVLAPPFLIARNARRNR